MAKFEYYDKIGYTLDRDEKFIYLISSINKNKTPQEIINHFKKQPMNKEFNFDTDLKAGMVIETEENITCMVFPTKDGLAIMKYGNYGWLKLPNDNVKEHIEKYYGKIIRISDLAVNKNIYGGDIIWKYSPTIELTIEDIAALKGCKPEQIKIIP